nr:hypothetical protein [Burkholderia sp. USMB20]
MLAVRVTRRPIGFDAGIRHGMPHGLAERRGTRIDSRHASARLGRHECIQHDRCVVGWRHGLVECHAIRIDSRHAHARLRRHECIQHDRCVVIGRRGFVRVRTDCVAGRGLMRVRNDPGRYGRRRGDAARRCNRAGHGRRSGRRRRRIGLPHTVQRRPLRGTGFDRAQRVVNARCRRDRLRGLLHPRIERRGAGAGGAGRRRAASGDWPAAPTPVTGRRRARRRRGGRARRDAVRGAPVASARAAAGRAAVGCGRTGSNPAQRGRTGARHLAVRGGAREAGRCAGRRGGMALVAPAAAAGACDWPTSASASRRRDRLGERTRRGLAARLRPRLRIGLPQRRGANTGPFCRGAIELTVWAVVGCTMSSSRCSALRGRSATPRTSSSTSRASLTPNDVSTHAANCRQPMPVSHGRPAKNSTTIATGVPIGPSTCAKPFENAWPSAFESGPDSGLVSAQLATNTAAKPSHRRIEPRPASPPPPGSIV